MASGEHPSTPSNGNGSFKPLQEQKLVLEKALKVAKSILSPRSGDATHHKTQDYEVTTGSSAGSAVPARDGPVIRSSDQKADLEHEISKLRKRISELEKQTGSTGDAAQDTRDLAYEIFRQFAVEHSAKKMTREEFKLAVESHAKLIEGTLDDLFNDMDTNRDNFIDPDEWKVGTIRQVSSCSVQ